MTLEGIERELRAAIEAAINDGWSIDRGSMFPGYKKCCALGAVVRGTQKKTDNDAFNTAIRRLGMSSNQGTSLARAFDGLMVRDDDDKRFSDLGRRLAADYVK